MTLLELSQHSLLSKSEANQIPQDCHLPSVTMGLGLHHVLLQNSCCENCSRFFQGDITFPPKTTLMHMRAPLEAHAIMIKLNSNSLGGCETIKFIIQSATRYMQYP